LIGLSLVDLLASLSARDGFLAHLCWYARPGEEVKRLAGEITQG
jgi:hypothetical protein